MRKTLVITAREYMAAVNTKAFVISLVLLPLMMAGSFFVQHLSQKIGDQTTKQVAVLDRTPGAVLFPVIERAAQARNASEIFDKKTGKQMHAKFVFERVEPAPIEDADAVMRQRFEWSERIRNGGLFAVVEIGQDVVSPKISRAAPAADAGARSGDLSADEKIAAAEAFIGEPNLIRYTSNRPTYTDLTAFLQRTPQQEIYLRRMEAAGLSADKVLPLLIPPQVASRGLINRDTSGKLNEDTKVNRVSAALLPVLLLTFMFMIVLVGTSPMTTNVIEEKQLRIAEVLLGSVRPFELMMGKLLGSVGVALTLAALYVGGALLAVNQYGLGKYVPPMVLVWFIVFTVVATFMYGALFVAAGAAVTNAKEAQSLISPIILLMVLPMFVIEPMYQDPSGPLPMAASFIPFSAPMMTTARIAIPPGIPAWQALLSVAVSLLTTVAPVWCAGRIFRLGLLMQGQAARPRDILRWVLRG
jgi:ABC-2 type transport system permease protein